MYSLKKVLIQRDGFTPEEAAWEVSRAFDHFLHLIAVGDLMSAEDFMMDEYGLEPDYMEDLMDGHI